MLIKLTENLWVKQDDIKSIRIDSYLATVVLDGVGQMEILCNSTEEVDYVIRAADSITADACQSDCRVKGFSTWYDATGVREASR